MASLASVFVEVRPDTSGFSTELKSSLSKAREAVDVAANLDTKRLKPQLAELKRELSTVQLTRATIQADTAQANAKIKALRLDLQGLNRSVKIDGKTDELTAKIAEIKAEIASITGGKAKLGIDSAQASAHLKVLQAQLAVFDHTDVTAKVHVESSGITKASQGVSLLLTAAVGIGPTLVPILSTVTAGIGLMASSLASAAGAGGLLAGVIKGNVSQYQALIKQQKQDATTLQTANRGVDAARISLDGAKKGTAAYQAASGRLKAALEQQHNAQAAVNADQRKMNNEYGPLTRGLDSVKKAWGGLLQSTRPQVMNLMGDALQTVARILPRLTPLVKLTARAVDGLVSDFGRFTKTARFQGILDFFQKYGPSAITSFGHILGNLAVGVGGLIGAFAPFQQHFLGGLENMTRAFANWGAGFGKSNGFRSFMKYAQGVLPDVRDLFKNLIGFVGKFVVALGPLAGIELKGLTAMLKGLNSLPPRVLTALAFSITGIVLGLRAWAVGVKIVAAAEGIGTAAVAVYTAATWLSTKAMTAGRNAALGTRIQLMLLAAGQRIAAVASTVFSVAMRGVGIAVRFALGPVGLILIGLTALAAGLVYAYQHSATFHHIVVQAFQMVKDGAHAVLQWFLKSFVPFFTKTIPNAFQAVLGWTRKNWPYLLGILAGPIGLATVYISRHWSQITDSFKSAWNWIKGTFSRWWHNTTAILGDAVHAGQVAISRSLANIRGFFSDIWHWVSNTFHRLWNGVEGVFTGAVQRAKVNISNLLDGIKNLLHTVAHWMMTVFRNDWAVIKSVFMNPLNFIKNAIQNMFGQGGPIRTAFDRAVSGIKTTLARLKEAARAPVAFIVNTVYNRGIVPVINAIPGIPGTLSTVKGWDTGGYTGAGGKHEPAGIVHRNEHVIRSESTTELNHVAPGFLDHLNKNGAKALSGLLPGYATGGAVQTFRPVRGGRLVQGIHDVSTGFPAIDLGVPIGTPVMAGTGGRVVVSKDLRGYEPRISHQNGYRSYGKYIQIQGPRGINTLYGHLSSRGVGVGATVRGGQRIGYSGNTGHSYGPHLHFGAQGTSPLVFLNGAAGHGVASGGAGSSSGYSGPSVGSVMASLNPMKWVNKLRGMGGWGPMLGGMVGSVGGALRNLAVSKVKSLIKAAFLGGGAPSPSGNVQRYANLVSHVLGDLGQPGTLVNTVLRRMNQESGGNINAVNRTDSNWQAGHPSVGLMQVIRGTYASNKPHPEMGHGPYLYGVSTFPYDNIYAGLKHAMTAYPGRSLASVLNQPGGYDSGGVAVGKGYMAKNIIAPERVLDPRTTRNFEELVHDVDSAKQYGSGSSRRQELVITNWREGTGYIRTLADDQIASASEFGATRKRMGTRIS